MSTSGRDIEPYVQSVLQQLDPEVLKTLTLVQLEALNKAIAGSDKNRRHTLDIRGTLPLFFCRYYFVLLAGRDRRGNTRKREQQRRKDAGMLGVLFSLYCLGCGLVLLTLLLMYIAKTLLNIDIFANSHLLDLLRPA